MHYIWSAKFFQSRLNIRYKNSAISIGKCDRLIAQEPMYNKSRLLATDSSCLQISIINYLITHIRFCTNYMFLIIKKRYFEIGATIQTHRAISMIIYFYLFIYT